MKAFCAELTQAPQKPDREGQRLMVGNMPWKSELYDLFSQLNRNASYV